MLLNHLSARLKAMATHLAISLTIFIITTLVLVYLLYPDSHFWINGGVQGLMLMCWIDIILGPVLTFLVYNPTKKTKAKFFDLLIIATVQFSAMAYGFYHVYQQRPIFLLLHPAATIETVSYQNLPESMKQLDFSKFPRLTKLPFVAYNPNVKQLEGLVSPDYQLKDALAKQSIMIKYLTPELAQRWEQVKKTHTGTLLIVQLVGAYKTEWLVLNDKMEYVDSLGSSITIQKTLTSTKQ